VEAVVVRAAARAWAGWGEVLYAVEDGDCEVAAQGGWAGVFDADDVITPPRTHNQIKEFSSVYMINLCFTVAARKAEWQ
jgi:hypothetical protein